MKIGILGGGQLGRMFIQNALNYDDEFHVLDPTLIVLVLIFHIFLKEILIIMKMFWLSVKTKM
jgi:hypothetical protein